MADCNLLFGVLALQLDFVTTGQLVSAMNEWSAARDEPLGAILVRQGALDGEVRAVLDALAERHLERHAGDARASLAVLPPLGDDARRDLATVGDGDVRQTLQQAGAVAADGGTLPMPARSGAGAAGPAAGLRYRVLRPHAKGGLGEIFVAEDTELGRRVALKEIQARHADDREARSRFVLEAEVTGGLEHPGIVPVYGLGAYPDGRPFYAMRFIEGDNLKDAIRRFHGPASGGGHAPGSEHRGVDTPRSPDFTSLEFRDLLRRFVDVCNAVAYAHSRGVLHRDLKPGNVMLGQFGETLLVDWGLAKVQASGGRQPSGTNGDATLQPRSAPDATATQTGQAMGTPAYMPPEQADGRLGDLGPASDVYSLGATLYELLTGAAAFGGTTLATTLDAVRAGRFASPRELRPGVPPALEAACLKAMARDPAARYESALDLARDVERWLADEPVTAYREPAAARLRRWVRRHARLATAVAAVLATGAAALGLLLAQSERARQAVAAERAVAAAERDQAVAARQRTREALDAMTSDLTQKVLARQAKLTPEQRKFFEEALAYYREFTAEAGGDAAATRRLLNAHRRLAMIHVRLGQPEEALRVNDRALELATGPEYRKFVAETEIGRGHLLDQLGRGADALAAYRRAAGVAAALVHDDPAAFATDSESHLALATCLAGRGQLDEARALFDRLRADCERSCSERPSDADRRRRLADVYHNEAMVHFHAKDLPRAVGALRAARDAYERLADTGGAPDDREKLGMTLINLAGVLTRAKDPAQGEATVRRAVAVYERLAADNPAVVDYRYKLGYALHNLEITLDELPGRAAEADAALRGALAQRERLVADYPNVPEYAIDLAATQLNGGHRAADRGQLEDALALYGRAVDRLRTALAADPTHENARDYLHKALTQRAGVLMRLKRFRDADADCDDLLKLVPPERHPFERVMRAVDRARNGDTRRAIADAEELSAAADAPLNVLFDCACVFALAGPALDAREREEYQARAVATLRRAFAAGFTNLRAFQTDADINPLRSRDDFADLAWQIADGLPAKK